MRLCERVNKIWVLSNVCVIGLLYVIFALYCDLNIEKWRTSKFNFVSAIVGSNYPKIESTTKKILYWNTFFGNENFYFGNGDVLKYCPGIATNCWATHSRSYFDVEDFDAVLFHGPELNVDDLPNARINEQRYIFVNLESPENRPILYSLFENNFFNLTMTYRLDSDIVWPYADVRELEYGNFVAPRLETVWREKSQEATGIRGTETSMIKDKTNKTKGKTKAAAWFVSNCKSSSGREKYVDELSKYVDVDIFGLCGKSTICPKEEFTTMECIKKFVEPVYYFYLSFENSMCDDYVTEKLYNALTYNVVPVVYGGANYSLFAPPKSYINALDFDSPYDLAQYMKKLMNEPKEYEKYFDWKENYEIATAMNRVFCQLCRYLNVNNKSKSYSHLSAWYKTDRCPLQEKLKKSPYLTKSDL